MFVYVEGNFERGKYIPKLRLGGQTTRGRAPRRVTLGRFDHMMEKGQVIALHRSLTKLLAKYGVRVTSDGWYVRDPVPSPGKVKYNLSDAKEGEHHAEVQPEEAR